MEKTVQRRDGMYFILMKTGYFAQNEYNGTRSYGSNHRNATKGDLFALNAVDRLLHM